MVRCLVRVSPDVKVGSVYVVLACVTVAEGVNDSVNDMLGLEMAVREP